MLIAIATGLVSEQYQWAKGVDLRPRPRERDLSTWFERKN